jgi:hypothetical protein
MLTNTGYISVQKDKFKIMIMVGLSKDSYRNGRNTHTDFSKIWNQ